jgi:hypothetical protein
MFELVTNPVIVGFTLPEWLTSASEENVRLTRGETLPTPQYIPKQLIGHGPEDGVNMVGHDNPGIQEIPLIDKMANGAGDNVSDIGSAQPARPCALVEVPLDPTMVITLNRRSCLAV